MRKGEGNENEVAVIRFATCKAIRITTCLEIPRGRFARAFLAGGDVIIANAQFRANLKGGTVLWRDSQ